MTLIRLACSAAPPHHEHHRPRWQLPLAVLLTGPLLWASSPALAEDEGEGKGEEDGRSAAVAVEGRDVVVSVLAPATAEQVARDYGLTVRGALPTSVDVAQLRAPEGTDLVALSSRLAADPRVRLAEPDRLTVAPEGAGNIYGWGGGPRSTGSDPATWTEQPALSQIRLERDAGTTRGAGVVVAVLDTGADLDHPALASHLLPGIDLVDGDASPDDTGNGIDDDGDGRVDEGFGHGTHVAGLVRVVAPDAQILPVRVLDTDARGSVFTVAEGIELAIARGADVINLSLGTPTASQLFDQVLAEASEDVVVVASAGNTADQQLQYPGASAGVLSVASVDADDVRSDFSTFGWVDVAAPGEAIVSTWVDGGYAVWGGTSMAAPLVAGQAALLIGAGGEDAAPRAVTAILSSATSLPSGLGDGRIDVAASLLAATSVD